MHEPEQSGVGSMMKTKRKLFGYGRPNAVVLCACLDEPCVELIHRISPFPENALIAQHAPTRPHLRR